MKQLKIKLPLRTMALAGGLLLATSSFAQTLLSRLEIVGAEKARI